MAHKGLTIWMEKKGRERHKDDRYNARINVKYFIMGHQKKDQETKLNESTYLTGRAKLCA